MPKQPTSWAASEVQQRGKVDTLRIASIGHLPEKSVQIDNHFAFDGFGIVLRGSGTYQCDEGPVYSFHAPALFYIWPGSRFRYGPHPNSTWEERYLCFTGSRLADWRRWGWLARPAKPVSLTNPCSAISGLHGQIAEAFHPIQQDDLDEAKLLTEQLVLHLSSLAKPAPPSRDELSALLLNWRLNPAVGVNLKQCAHDLGLSYSGFRAKVLERTGQSAYQFILNLRLDQSANHLINSDQQIKAIAFANGFSSLESFDRAFHRRFQLSPGKYRRRHRAMITGRSGRLDLA